MVFVSLFRFGSGPRPLVREALCRDLRFFDSLRGFSYPPTGHTNSAQTEKRDQQQTDPQGGRVHVAGALTVGFGHRGRAKKLARGGDDAI